MVDAPQPLPDEAPTGDPSPRPQAETDVATVVVATRLGPATLPLPGRVVVRYLLPDGDANDALGVLESADDAVLVVRPDRHPDSDPVVIDATRVVAAKPVPPRSRRRPPRAG